MEVAPSRLPLASSERRLAAAAIGNRIDYPPPFYFMCLFWRPKTLVLEGGDGQAEQQKGACRCGIGAQLPQLAAARAAMRQQVGCGENRLGLEGGRRGRGRRRARGGSASPGAGGIGMEASAREQRRRSSDARCIVKKQMTISTEKTTEGN